MAKDAQKTNMLLKGALITALGGIVVAFITGRYSILSQTEPIQMIIDATKTAEFSLTQAVYMAATATAVSEQKLESYTLSIPLPGAHIPPIDGQSTANADFAIARRIQIPSISVDSSIVQGDGWEELKKGVGQKLGSANPGESGYIILSAHNDIFGEIFRYLDQLKQGDEIILHTLNDQYSYYVDSNRIVSSSNLEFTYSPNESLLILTSSYPYLQDDSWIVVFAIQSDE